MLEGGLPAYKPYRVLSAWVWDGWCVAERCFLFTVLKKEAAKTSATPSGMGDVIGHHPRRENFWHKKATQSSGFFFGCLA
jgi:hypothetical protein